MVTPLRVMQNGQMVQNEMTPTLIINPNNPPPWIQNRQPQPQVVYIQQPVAYLPQPIDQQFYIQNYGCQNPPQMFISNYEQFRPYQIQMAMPNPDQNLANERIFVQNVPSDPNAFNGQIMQNEIKPVQFQNIPNQVYNITQDSVNLPQMHGFMNPNIVVSNPNPNISVARQINENIVNNTHRQQDVNLPSNIPSRPEANTVVRPPIVTIQNQTQPVYRQMVSNVIRPINATVRPSPVVTYPDKRPPLPRQSISIIRNNIIRTPRLAYRPIQPRPLGIRAQVINPTMQMQFVPTYPNLNNTTYTTTTIPPSTIPRQTIPPPTLQVYPENNINNRKRKSESPDEIKNKLKILGLNSNPILRGHLVNNSTNTVDVGVSTNIATETPVINPIVKAETVDKLVNSISVTTQVQKGDLELPKKTLQIIDTCDKPTTSQSVPTKPEHQLDKDKLVRSTLFPQARGRILNDKSTEPMQENKQSSLDKMENESQEPPSIAQIEKTEPNIVKEINNENVNDINKNTHGISLNNIRNNTQDMKLTEKDYILTHVLDGFVIQESNVAFPIQKPVKEKIIKLSKERDEALSKLLESTKEIRSEIDNKHDTSSDKDKTCVINSVTDQQLEINSRIGKQHQNNSDIEKKHEINSRTDKEHLINSRIDKKNETNSEIDKKNEKISGVDQKCKMNSGDGKEREVYTRVDKKHETVINPDKSSSNEKKNEESKDSPFSSLDTKTVRSWTVDKLASHLENYGWNTTASVFSEHEIDGESLFLVAKSQLQCIGVDDMHADIILQFINSS
ncbi:uncharacterized protein LOC126968305 isoform X2 [Leptidea sinapis]|uniref:uncharacterized protein LOC126968305 isoform X2 n=1 Tax=Leptidea sinapis TaxID=189913 RepID=UPI0021C31F1E|nr:uncharacterized protein LOC126968305 isoform X2 [Leptidea sinapis]